VKSLWNDSEAAQFPGELGLRVYTSRLLGRDPSLVLHGGGNTSVKIREKDIFGEEQDILYVKGSGWDLETIQAAGFSPCRMGHLLRLAQLKELPDLEMARELKSNMLNASAPMPSVEAILHALLPAKYVDHTHTDALIAVMNNASGEERIRSIYGDRVVVIPYVMPGFRLARLCAELYPKQAGPRTVGMVLMNHGLFTFGETAREAYERMIELVTLAEEYIALKVGRDLRGASGSAETPTADTDPAAALAYATLRRDVSSALGAPAILLADDTAAGTAFARRPDIASISQRGPATPDHVIRTKRVPMLGRDVAAYARAYGEYFAPLAAASGAKLTMLDPAPRIILDPEFGLLTVGKTAKEASIGRDIYRRTVDIILRAEALGGWKALPASDIFEVEYWDLEQAKLRAGGEPPPFAGEVALVTGAASGIGKACVESLLKRGAAVVGLDVNPAVAALHRRPDFRGIACDLTSEAEVSAALARAVRAFGGLDMLVLNAGIFPKGCDLAQMTTELWRRVMSVNLDANFFLMRACHPFLKLAPKGGRVAVIGSKNVPAPGPGAAAYSASKAAVNQLARVAALEWGKDRIRINSLHPNMVFDTALWTPEILKARAKHYGLTVEQYKTNNVLRVEVASRDVAELAAALCGPLFAKTTAAQIPVDGGNDRVI
jgi:rhamnose utilization protein RhaD (predicted bifunctional aldolase and dehydrogenase)/NAD(P)-dependent dehydrogenase (short-subunit alcohol dehydrogenase family)